MSLIESAIAQRLGGRQFGKSGGSYKFAAIKQAKAELARLRPDLPLIDMGVGEPDSPADPGVVAELARQAGLAGNRFYADNGIPEFQDAANAYLRQTCGVQGLDSPTQIMHGIGSKPILAMLPLCLINPGDYLLSTVPGYPVCATHASYLGGRVWPLPLLASNGFLPDLEAIPRRVLRRATAIYLNYPNNPTGAVATPDFFDRVIAFAQRHGIAVIHDAAYAELSYGETQPLSFLSRPGASDVGVEVHSLSKSRNMTGWRLGFVAGNAKLVQAYSVVKGNSDSGQFRAIQLAGIQALANTGICDASRATYSRRFDLLVAALQGLGFAAAKPSAGFYCYVPAPLKAGPSDGDPKTQAFTSATEAADYLLRHAGISTVPWDEAGAYLRFSVTFEADGMAEEKRVIQEMSQRLASLNLSFA